MLYNPTYIDVIKEEDKVKASVKNLFKKKKKEDK